MQLESRSDSEAALLGHSVLRLAQQEGFTSPGETASSVVCSKMVFECLCCWTLCWRLCGWFSLGSQTKRTGSKDSSARGLFRWSWIVIRRVRVRQGGEGASDGRGCDHLRLPPGCTRVSSHPGSGIGSGLPSLYLVGQLSRWIKWGLAKECCWTEKRRCWWSRTDGDIT